MSVDLILAASAIAVALLIGLAAVGSALGIGQVAAKFIEGTARQPQLANTLQAKMFMAAGLLDAIPMMAVAIGMFMMFANPMVPTE